jgi:hypothetical protein
VSASAPPKHPLCLVAFVLSTPVSQLFDAKMLVNFTAFIQQKLAAQGSIPITKDTGLFEAY